MHIAQIHDSDRRKISIETCSCISSLRTRLIMDLWETNMQDSLLNYSRAYWTQQRWQTRKTSIQSISISKINTGIPHNLTASVVAGRRARPCSPKLRCRRHKSAHRIWSNRMTRGTMTSIQTRCRTQSITFSIRAMSRSKTRLSSASERVLAAHPNEQWAGSTLISEVRQISSHKKRIESLSSPEAVHT